MPGHIRRWGSNAMLVIAETSWRIDFDNKIFEGPMFE